MQNLQIFRLVLLSGIFSSTLLIVTSQSTNFSQQFLVVWFSPDVSRYIPRNAYNQSHFIALTAQIATKFTRILMPPFYSDDRDNDLLEIPLAVATYNKLHRSPHRPNPPPLELVMIFKEDFFNLTKQIADQTNMISSATVRTLLYMPEPLLSEDTMSEVVNHLVEYKSELGTRAGTAATPIPYKLGLYTAIESCGPSESDDELLPLSLRPVLLHLDAIFFHRFPTFSWNYEYAHGAATSAGNLINLMTFCKVKLLKANPSLAEVGVRTHWPATGKDGVRNVDQFYLYWDLLNDFAASTNTTVVPSEAFDDFEKGKWQVGYDTLGWWRLVERDGHGVTNPADFVFEEKAQSTVTPTTRVSLPASVDSSPKPVKDGDDDEDHGQGTTFSHSNVDSSTVALVVVGATSAGLILGAVTATIFYKYMIKRAKQKVQQNRDDEGEDEDITSFSLSGAGQDLIIGTPPSALTECPNELVRKLEEEDHQPVSVGLQVDISRVEICHNVILGSGEFGVVRRGSLRDEDSGQLLPVAVKIPKPKSPIALEAIRSESQILSYVGHHENVLKLVGVVVSRRSPADLFLMVTELCELGSLEEHLWSLRSDEFQASIITPIGSGEAGPYCNWSEPTFLRELKKWSYQIAGGMEYLTSKHVVHADLATRNVLLTSSKIAKVSDLGLSRRLAEEANYYKKGDTTGGAPWRWMSPESLRHWKFNEKSDVWAFGVTLWEMFSLGETPYNNSAWTEEFEIELDQKNMRLSRPKWSGLDMYDIMVTCWEPKPGDRPSFADLRLMLEKHGAQQP